MVLKDTELGPACIAAVCLSAAVLLFSFLLLKLGHHKVCVCDLTSACLVSDLTPACLRTQKFWKCFINPVFSMASECSMFSVRAQARHCAAMHALGSWLRSTVVAAFVHLFDTSFWYAPQIWPKSLDVFNVPLYLACCIKAYTHGAWLDTWISVLITGCTAAFMLVSTNSPFSLDLCERC